MFARPCLITGNAVYRALLDRNRTGLVMGPLDRSETNRPSERVVFISYARTDSALVRKIRLIVWASGALPWRDEEAIDPGCLWRSEIAKAISTCERMIVFWCQHAQQSEYVASEYRQAIKESKHIVPIQLDGTALPSDLSEYQAIDVRELAGWGHSLKRLERWLWVAGLLALGLGLAVHGPS